MCVSPYSHAEHAFLSATSAMVVFYILNGQRFHIFTSRLKITPGYQGMRVRQISLHPVVGTDKVDGWGNDVFPDNFAITKDNSHMKSGTFCTLRFLIYSHGLIK